MSSLTLDFFNGDADGIIALSIFRRAKPEPSAQRITGVKRDIELLAKIAAKKAQLFVFDISLESNKEFLLPWLQADSEILWFDHHHVGDATEHPKLIRQIDPNPNLCTALLVHQFLEGADALWAATAAFGDNLLAPARALACQAGLEEAETERLKELGRAINYNSYGKKVQDLLVHPEELYLELVQYGDPLDYAKKSPLYARILAQFKQDKMELEKSKILYDTSGGTILLLPDNEASTRYSGIYSNDLVYENPKKAHAVLTHFNNGFRLSIRAPLENPTRADELALLFPQGGGRAKAAGIQCLPQDQLPRFIDLFSSFYSGE